ncbi:MAG: cytidylate kinase-like family protein [Ignavibacteriaceae bacterium]
MKVLGAYEKCKLYISRKSEESKKYGENRKKPESCPFITISRQTGTGAGYLSQLLINYLQRFSDPDTCNWTFFDRKLIEKVLEDHNLPAEISNYMKEDKYRHISTTVQELLGLHPGKWTLLHKTTETILQLARMGNVVIVGRAANIITAKLRLGFHVRLVAPLEVRASRIRDRLNCPEREAINYIKEEDAARKNFVKSHFYKNAEDPLLYHMVLNMGLFSHEEAARIIGDCVMEKFKDKFEKFSVSVA